MSNVSGFSFAKQFNKERLFPIETTGFEYISLAELYAKHGAEQVYILRAMYRNDMGLFEPSPTFVIDGYFVNIPSHMMQTYEAVMKSPEAIAAINEEKVGFKIREYMATKYGKLCYSVEFVDL